MKSSRPVKRRSLDHLHVHRTAGDKRRGRLRAGALSLPCALGSGGPGRVKREGDGGTPVARMRVLGILFRPDKLSRPRCGPAARAITRRDGWCDDRRSVLYNRPVRLPFAGSHERLWRDDDLYDVVLDLGWNRGPIRPGRGSAIFLHVARPGFAPTEGCIALARAALIRLVPRIGRRTVVHVHG